MKTEAISVGLTATAVQVANSVLAHFEAQSVAVIHQAQEASQVALMQSMLDLVARCNQ